VTESVTRVAIQLRLRRAAESSAMLSVYNVENQVEERVDGYPKTMPQENGWLWVQDEMLRLGAQFSGNNAQLVKERIIVLEVKRPDIPSIDLVDLPGLTTHPANKAIEIQAILKRQLEEDRRSGGHSMYLAVVPAAGDVRPTTNNAIGFIQEHGLQAKTFGVFSKCDQCSDKDILRALLTGDDTEEGDSAESMGAVKLEKGWVATMLKPPRGKEFETHNFERILIQQREDTKYFEGDDDFRQLYQQGYAGIGALVDKLETQYSEYLNTTWKTSALTKVLEKLGEKEYERGILGVVPSNENQRDKLAREEVSRRFACDDSPTQTVYNDFTTQFVRDRLCQSVQHELNKIQQVQWAGWSVHVNLKHTRDAVRDAVRTVLADIPGFWTDRLRQILTAESQIEENGEEIKIVTAGHGARLCLVRLFKKSSREQRLRQALKQKPLIQLSKYTEFTTAIMAKCDELFQDAVAKLQAAVEDLCDRLVDLDSPYVSRSPVLVAADPKRKPPVASNVVDVTCKVSDFLNALVSLFFQMIPSPSDLQTVHHGIKVGTEEKQVFDQYAAITEEIKKIEAARDGILSALSISDAEFEAFQQSLEAAA